MVRTDCYQLLSENLLLFTTLMVNKIKENKMKDYIYSNTDN